jgi:hypothetical protein
MDELNLTVDMIEEQIVKGNLRWLANLSEIHRDFQLEDIRIPLYASGGLEEKGFLLSRMFSTLVTPKYKVHFLVDTSPEFDERFLRKLITACKRKFGKDNWTFLVLVQNRAIEKSARNFIESLEDPTTGVVVYSPTPKDEAISKNVLGRGLKKQLRLTEAKFEAFDLPDYIKSFTIAFGISTLALVSLQTVFGISVFNLTILPITLLLLFLFSIIVGHSLYKSRYHTTLLMDTKGFELRKGQSLVKKKWTDFKDATIYITPRHETCIRLYGEKEKIDLPLSRTGLSRKEMYNNIRQMLK